MNKTRHILGLSGGKDSTALALLMRDKVPEMEYVFCDTGEELPETYDYLDRVEAYLGKKIIRLRSEHTFLQLLDKMFNGYLPSANMRWCTVQLKLKPFEDYIGAGDVVNYVGIRADEDRVGLISTRPNLKTVFPFKEHNINYAGVIKLLEDSGIGLPPYLAWGRTHSGCYFCFYQQTIEWVRLKEKYPDYFAKAKALEKNDSKHPGKVFTWIQGMPLSELEKPETMERIKSQQAARDALKSKIKSKSLVSILGGRELPEERPKACLMCQL